MQAQATVTRIVGHGASAIRDALNRGIITGEMKRHCEAVVRENEQLKKALKGKDTRIQQLQRENERLQADADEMRTVRMTVYQGMVEGRYGLLDERRRWGDLPQAIAGFAVGAVFVATIALIVI